MMKEILEAIEKVCSNYFGEHSPITAKIGLIISIAILATLLIIAIRKIVINFVLKRNQKILNKDLQPFFSKTDVIRATKYYVLPKYQNVAPSEDEELGTQYIASAKEKLVPLFLDKVFKKDKLDEKFFLVLADTGMGKTSFLINLYIKYKNKKGKFYSPFEYDIKLLPLGLAEIMDKIKSIQNKENTILLLDAFDEDINALDRHDERMKELIAVVKDFRFIVITCRTQFFPSEKEEPERTKYLTFGDTGKEYKFQKVYLSTFDNDDINKYLFNRFGFRFTKKYKKAKQIAQKSPNLVVRPLLLSYIDDLLQHKENYEYTVDIYKELINKWIEREAKKPGMQEKYGSFEEYKRKLYDFSKNLAYDLYINRKIRGGYFIGNNEKIPNTNLMQLSDIESDYVLTDGEKRSKSLLNRNSMGRYKFSHKSILEYFLAKILSEKDLTFYLNFDFEGMSMTKSFFDEFAIKFISDIEKNKGGHVFGYNNVESKSFIDKIFNLNRNEKNFHKMTFYEKKYIRSLYIRSYQPLTFNYAYIIAFKNLRRINLDVRTEQFYFFLNNMLYILSLCYYKKLEAVELEVFSPEANPNDTVYYDIIYTNEGRKLNYNANDTLATLVRGEKIAKDASQYYSVYNNDKFTHLKKTIQNLSFLKLVLDLPADDPLLFSLVRYESMPKIHKSDLSQLADFKKTTLNEINRNLSISVASEFNAIDNICCALAQYQELNQYEIETILCAIDSTVKNIILLNKAIPECKFSFGV